jgi:hypothetical protein
MPKRTDINKILIIGAGPIIISQACEFDYSGTQACKALKKEGYEVVLVNSNPATIMTDPEMADRTYIEPVVPQTVAKIIEKPCFPHSVARQASILQLKLPKWVCWTNMMLKSSGLRLGRSKRLRAESFFEALWRISAFAFPKAGLPPI